MRPMSASHLFYIPLVLIVGLVLGTALGRRAAHLEHEEEEAARRSREAHAAEEDAR